MEYTEFDIENSVIEFLSQENLELYDINMLITQLLTKLKYMYFLKN